MAKNIVICCDGTGNEVHAGELTNVVKLYRLLDKSDPSQQVTYYDPGVGTLAAPGIQLGPIKFMSRLFGLAFGNGLFGNVKNAYRYLMQTYEPGDRIYLFGFSRGAYTVRALAGLICMCGLLERNNDNLIDYAIKLHRTRKIRRSGKNKGKKEPDWKGAARFKKYFGQDCSIHFIGVWDTVKSVGLFRRSLILPFTRDNRRLKHGRHAVAINEKRSKYRPNLWEYSDGDKFQQVWFAGVHSDVGGSYEEKGLSQVTLEWMIRESQRFQLKVAEDWPEEIKPDPMDKVHNPLLPFWWMLGWRKRRLPEGAWVHKTVQQRFTHDEEYAEEVQSMIPGSVVWIS